MCCCCHRHLISVAAIVPTSSCDSSNIRECMSWQVLGLILSIVIERHHQKREKLKRVRFQTCFFHPRFDVVLKTLSHTNNLAWAPTTYIPTISILIYVCATQKLFLSTRWNKKSRNENVMSPSVLESVSKDPFSLNVRWKLFQFTETWRHRDTRGESSLFLIRARNKKRKNDSKEGILSFLWDILSPLFAFLL